MGFRSSPFILNEFQTTQRESSLELELMSYQEGRERASEIYIYRNKKRDGKRQRQRHRNIEPCLFFSSFLPFVLSFYPSIILFIFLSFYLSFYLSIVLSATTGYLPGPPSGKICSIARTANRKTRTIPASAPITNEMLSMKSRVAVIPSDRTTLPISVISRKRRLANLNQRASARPQRQDRKRNLYRWRYGVQENPKKTNHDDDEYDSILFD